MNSWSEHKLKTLRTDNGGKFTSLEFEIRRSQARVECPKNPRAEWSG